MHSILIKNIVNNKWCPKVILFVTIFGIHLFYINKVGMQVPWDVDDYRTFMIGAFLSGKYNLSDLHHYQTTITYYGPGQQLLYLPLFYLFNDLKVIFRIQVILNAAISSIVPTLAFSIFEKLKIATNDKMRFLLSFLVGIFPPIIYGTIGTKNEALLMTLPIVIMYLLTVIMENNQIRKKYLYSVLLGILTLYEYTLNERAIVVIFSVAICVLYDFARKRKKISLPYFIIPFALGWLLYAKLKNYILEDYFNSIRIITYTANTSDSLTSSIFSRLASFIDISFEQFINWITMSFGNFFYVIVATGGMVLFAIACIPKIRKLENSIIYIYALTIFLLNWLMISIVTRTTFWDVSESLLDYYIYGRYSDSCILPVLIIGIVLFTKYKSDRKVKNTFIILLAISIIIIVAEYAPKLIASGTKSYRIQNIAFLASLMSDTFKSNPKVSDFLLIGNKLLSFSLLLLALARVKKEWLIVIASLAIFFRGANFATDNYISIVNLQNERIEMCESIFEPIGDYVPEECKAVYLMYDSGMWRGVNLQFALEDWKVYQIDIQEDIVEEVSEVYGYIKENTFIMVHSTYDISKLGTYMHVATFSDSRDEYFIYAYGNKLIEILEMNHHQSRMIF